MNRYFLFFISLFMIWISVSAKAEIRAMHADDKAALTEARQLCVKILEENMIPFWMNTIDENGGGYMLNHDVNGKLLGSGNKALVTQSRTLWFFARLYRSPFGKPEHLKAAEHGYRFMMDKMRDPQHDGFYWEVDASGEKAARPDKHLYGQSFALYALSEYALATGDSSAKAAAQAFFSHLDYVAHDRQYSGYHESFSRDWQPLPGGQSNYMGVPSGMKLMNTHLHLMEAFTAYYQAANDSLSRERLLELIFIESSAVIRKQLPASTDKFQPNWTPMLEGNYARVSYGHDVENIWLLREACDAAGIPTTPLMDLFREVFAYALQYGYDAQDGGFYDSGTFNEPADQRRKVWWVQSEALVSALTMYQLTGDKLYLETFKQTLDWVNKKQVDWTNGDWHSNIEEDGSPSGGKANAWKSPYHNGRAMIECIRLMDAMMKLPVE